MPDGTPASNFPLHPVPPPTPAEYVAEIYHKKKLKFSILKLFFFSCKEENNQQTLFFFLDNYQIF